MGNFSTLIVMAAAIELEGAVDHTGPVENIAHLPASMGRENPIVALAAVFVGAVFLSNFMAHAAAVALRFPIALSMATNLSISFNQTLQTSDGFRVQASRVGID